VRLSAATAFSAVLLLVLAACSSSGNKSNGGTPSGSKSSTGSGAAAPSGDPVRIGVIYTADNQTGNAPGIEKGAEAAAAYIDGELGGINGHPVEVVACNGKNSPESDTQCATRFVSSKVVNVIGLDGLWGDNGQPVTVKAGIVNQTTPLSAGELTGADSYPFDGGPTAGAGAVAAYAIKKGWKSVACVYIDLASVKPGCDVNLATPVKAAGMKFVSVAVPPTATDFAQYAQAATVNNPDGILLLQAASSNARFVTAATQLGKKTQYFASNIAASSDYFTIGAPADGTIFYFPNNVWTDTGNADVKIFVDAMAKYAKGTEVSAQSEQGFVGVMNVQRIAKTMTASDLSASAFANAFKTVSNFQSFAGPVLNASDHLPGLPNVYLTGAYLYQYKGGKFTEAAEGLVKGTG
jgi:branched-chain amino acid transport system substrate-binding protein